MQFESNPPQSYKILGVGERNTFVGLYSLTFSAMMVCSAITTNYYDYDNRRLDDRCNRDCAWTLRILCYKQDRLWYGHRMIRRRGRLCYFSCILSLVLHHCNTESLSFSLLSSYILLSFYHIFLLLFCVQYNIIYMLAHFGQRSCLYVCILNYIIYVQ